MNLLAGSVPYLVQLPGLSFIPESPRWLVSAIFQNSINIMSKLVTLCIYIVVCFPIHFEPKLRGKSFCECFSVCALFHSRDYNYWTSIFDSKGVTPEKSIKKNILAYFSNFQIFLTIMILQMKMGQAEESENALRRLMGEKADVSQEITDIKVSLLL